MILTASSIETKIKKEDFQKSSEKNNFKHFLITLYMKRKLSKDFLKIFKPKEDRGKNIKLYS